MVATDITDLTFFPIGTILTFSSAAWADTSPAFKNIWKICDGTDSRTPNLTAKFLCGSNVNAGNYGAIGGGSITIGANNLPTHTHTIGSHTHTLSGTLESESHTHGYTPSGSISGGSHSHPITDPGHKHKMTVRNRYDGSGNGFNQWYGSSEGETENAITNITGTETSTSHHHDFTPSPNLSTNPSGSHTHSLTGVSVSGGSGSTGNNTSTGTAISVVPSFYTVIYIMKVA